MKLLFQIYILLAIFSLAVSEDVCGISPDSRKDCGFVGITQTQCENKGCCFRQNVGEQQEYQTILKRFLGIHKADDTVPYCYFSTAGDTCEKLDFKGTDAGFQNQYNGLYSEFMENINMFDEGGVVAAPDKNTPGGNYFYHWMRDAALTMRTFIEINDSDLSKIQFNMEKYVSWVIHVQHDSDPNGISVFVEPKFELYTQQVYDGPWCRPQTDGPGLRATTLIKYANILLDTKDQDNIDYVNSRLFNSQGTGAINKDLDWVIGGWQDNGCDLWEEIRSTDFFWNRMAFHQALVLGAQLADRLSISDKYTSVANEIKPTLYKHWNGKFVQQSTNRPEDSSVVHAFVNLNEDVYAFNSKELAGTIKTLNDIFCEEYTINKKDNLNDMPGILYGRYPGDIYAGGNPWQLLTAGLAEAFYELALEVNQTGSAKMSSEDIQMWNTVLDVPAKVTGTQFAKIAKQAGDAVMQRLWYHVQGNEYELDEQIDRNDGFQMSAKKLTWSYANVLRTLHKYVQNDTLNNL